MDDKDRDIIKNILHKTKICNAEYNSYLRAELFTIPLTDEERSVVINSLSNLIAEPEKPQAVDEISKPVPITCMSEYGGFLYIGTSEGMYRVLPQDQVCERIGLEEVEQVSIDKLNQAYTERNILAAICARLAAKIGYRAGVRKDLDSGFDEEWQNIIAIELPAGQISYHIAPDDLEVLKGLPNTTVEWDGTFNSKDVNFPYKIVAKDHSDD